MINGLKFLAYIFTRIFIMCSQVRELTQPSHNVSRVYTSKEYTHIEYWVKVLLLIHETRVEDTWN